jgi:hypothetical protein
MLPPGVFYTGEIRKKRKKKRGKNRQIRILSFHGVAKHVEGL